MAANFPSSAPNLSTNKQDNIDDVLAADHNRQSEEINAIAGFIGVNGSGIHSLTEKTTPADNDEVGLLDSAASYVLKRLSFLNVKVAIGSFLNPVGTIREFNVATNPATLLGFGTWAEYGKGRVTVAINATDTEFDTLEKTGGEKAHLLTGAESGEKGHNHTQNAHSHAKPSPLSSYLGGGGSNGALGSGSGWSSTTNDVASTTATNNAVAASNAAQAHNNLQPYIVVYRWVRTA